MQILTRECPRCGKAFSFETKPGGTRSYCDDCGTVGGRNPRITKNCNACGTTFIGGVKQKYCSHHCRNERKKLEAQQRRIDAISATEKHCGRCDRTLPLSSFRKDKNRVDGLYCWCSDCTRQYMGTAKRPDSKWSSKREYDANRRQILKDQLKDEWFARYLWTQYRLTEDQYYAMLSAQNGRCAICRTADAGAGRGRRNGRFHVDHDHQCCPERSCGKCVRGLLCNHCNTGIGFLRDDPQVLRSAIKYLSAPPARTNLKSDVQLILAV